MKLWRQTWPLIKRKFLWLSTNVLIPTAQNAHMMPVVFQKVLFVRNANLDSNFLTDGVRRSERRRRQFSRWSCKWRPWWQPCFQACFFQVVRSGSQPTIWISPDQLWSCPKRTLTFMTWTSDWQTCTGWTHTRFCGSLTRQFKGLGWIETQVKSLLIIDMRSLTLFTIFWRQHSFFFQCWFSLEEFGSWRLWWNECLKTNTWTRWQITSSIVFSLKF